MTELDLIDEEIAEIEAERRRIKASMNRQDNGVKLRRLTIITRTMGRLQKERSRLEQAA